MMSPGHFIQAVYRVFGPFGHFAGRLADAPGVGVDRGHHAGGPHGRACRHAQQHPAAERT